MGKTPFFSADGLKKRAWTAEEDQKLISYIQKHGVGGWRSLAEKAGLQRCGKSCRLRWTNYLRPGVKRGNFTADEDQTIIELHAALGNSNSQALVKEADNEVKNYWNAHLKKCLANLGIDPVTHRPVGTTPGASSSGNSNTTVVNTDSVIIHEENATAVESEHTLQQPKSLRSTSASALFLNKLATRAMTLQCVDPLRACQRLQPMSFNRITGDAGANSENTTAIVCQPTSSCQGSNSSIAPDDTSDYCSDNTAYLHPTPLYCLDLSKIEFSPESAEYGNASDDGSVSVEPPRSVSSSTSSQVRKIIASQFASLSCIDELLDWEHNYIPPGPIQGDHSDATTTTADAGVSAGDINIDDMIFDTVGSPAFYSPNNLENELEPTDLFDIP